MNYEGFWNTLVRTNYNKPEFVIEMGICQKCYWHMPLIGLTYKKSRKEQFMSRPVKCRNVCHFPNVLEFFPTGDYIKKLPLFWASMSMRQSVFWTKKVIVRSSVLYPCRLQEQRFSEFMRLPERKLQMPLLTDIHSGSKVGISESAMVREVTVALEDVTKRNFIKNMQ